MPKKSQISAASFPTASLPPGWTGKRLLYVALGTVLSVCVLCVTGIAVIVPPRRYPQQLLAFGAKGTGPGQFKVASYLALDGHGNIYVADWNDGHINIFGPDGKFLRLLDLGSGTIILGLAVAPDGTLYVSHDGTIERRDPDGKKSTLSYADARGDRLADVSGIALGPDGGLAAADNLGDVLAFAPDGSAHPVLARAFDLPSFSSRNELEPGGPPSLSYDVPANSADTNVSVALDRARNIYAVGWNNWLGLKTDAAGHSLSKFGAPAHIPGGWERGHLYFPDSLAIDSHGRIYVGDSNGVQVFGTDEQFLFSVPLSGGVDALALDAQDNLFVVTYPPQVLKLAAQQP